jgi:hypothetical protein
MKRAIGALAFCCLVLVAFPVAGQVDRVTHTRNLEARYGTAQAVNSDGNPIGTRSFLELTDHVTAVLAISIATEPGRDSRVTSNIASWIDNTVPDIEWIFGTLEGLDAAGNLGNDLESFGGPTQAIISDTGVIDRGSQSYEIASYTTFEPDGSGGTIEIEHTAIANVHYYERNIVKAVSPLVAAPALSPRMLAALFVALLAFGARRLRVGQRTRQA